MRKNYLYIVLLLLLHISVFGQKVSLTPTVVNGVGYSSGSINLGSSSISTISLGVKVEFPADPGNNGTINIYYEKGSSLGAIIPAGGNGGSLFFGGGKIGLANFVIYLNSSDFNTSGGYIYAQYKTSSGLAYKSTNIAIIKNGTVTPPTPIPPSEYPIQSVPYGGTPLLPQYVYVTGYGEIQSQEWIINDNIPFEGIRNDKKLYTAGPNTLKQKTTYKDGSINYSSKITARVVNFLPDLEDLYVDNKISSNQYLKEGEAPETIIGNQATESHTVKAEGQRNQTVTNPLSNYQWQTRTKFPLFWFNFGRAYFNSYSWNDISGATQINYTPPITNTGMEYRRLIIENPSSNASPETRRSSTSNVVTILPLQKDQINICCNETFYIGDEYVLNGPNQGESSFQWQISYDGTYWNDIFSANNKDFKAAYVYQTTRSSRQIQSQTQLYRRITYNYTNNQYYLSNIVSVNFLARNGSLVSIYPNPTSSILNLESTKVDLANAQISIANLEGNLVNPNSYQIITSNLVSIEISNLTSGPYFLNIQTGTRSYKYTFIKQ